MRIAPGLPVVALALAALASPADAMRFHADPPFLHLEGRVVDDDFRIWQDAMRTFGDRLLYIHPSQRESDDKALAFLCQGAQRHDRRDKECTSMPGVDALEKGVVTTWDAVRVPRMPSAEETRSRRNW